MWIGLPRQGRQLPTSNALETSDNASAAIHKTSAVSNENVLSSGSISVLHSEMLDALER